MELRLIHFICTEIYKTINNIGPEYINNLVVPNQSHYSSRRPLNLFVPRINQTTYGLRSFRYLGTILWNSLPEEIKTVSNLNSFSPGKDHIVDAIFAPGIMERIRVCLLASLTTQSRNNFSMSILLFCLPIILFSFFLFLSLLLSYINNVNKFLV